MQKLLAILLLLLTNLTFAGNITIVAAENFYGELAKEIGGNHVEVTSIISNPNADPHLFAITSATNIAISKAQIIIYNGNSYDSWMDQILKSQSVKNFHIINVANLMQLNTSNINPHIWYKPETMPTLAINIANLLIKLDNKHKSDYQNNLSNFLKENQSVQSTVLRLKAKYSNLPVTATEPVYNYMTDAIGLKMEGLDFQWKIMNGTEPSPKMLGQYVVLFTLRKIRVLFYNNQVTDGTTINILNIAQKNNIPIIGISETMPKNITINKWLLNGLDQTEHALAKSYK